MQRQVRGHEKGVSVLAEVYVAALCACRGDAVPDDPGAPGQLGEGAGGTECPPG